MQSLVSIANLHWGGRVAQSPRLFPLFPLPPSATSACPSASLLVSISAPSYDHFSFFPRIRQIFLNSCLVRISTAAELSTCPGDKIPCFSLFANRSLYNGGEIRNFDSRCFSFSFFFFVSFLFPNWWNLFRRGSIGEVKRGKIEFIDYHSN